MKTFQEHCDGMELETFDPAAFQGDDKVPQKLCNFVLALALIYNDSKNIIHAAMLLRDSKPAGKPEKTVAWGTYAGIDRHLFRLMIGLVHELFNLIQNHQDVLIHEFLAKVVKQLHPSSRKAWQSLTRVASERTPEDDFGRLLLRIRNQSAFHYDPKGIFAGFKTMFLGQSPRQTRAYISRGLSMEKSRFYFADAAVEGYFRNVVGSEEGDFLLTVLDSHQSLNLALLSLVDRFIQLRGFAYSNT